MLPLHPAPTVSHLHAKNSKTHTFRFMFSGLWTHLCCDKVCACCSLCVISSAGSAGSLPSSLSLPLWAGVECVLVCVSSLTGYCYRELSQTEHAPNVNNPCGWHRNQEAAVKLPPAPDVHTLREQSAGRCCSCIIILVTYRHLINP